ncbi:MAG: NAD(P)-dependent oxidoreductase [Legionellales bacterium]|nr:NAD(P)-dependent oxidoreductase [Legionellales bacterium]|tara:strand:- start:257 stop:1201 length:945 start_codon:yes stop_codon:yes gene_type:complete
MVFKEYKNTSSTTPNGGDVKQAPLKILILGSSGMLGSALLHYFISKQYQVWGTVRNQDSYDVLPRYMQAQVIKIADIENMDALASMLTQIMPDVVINCIGLVKQLMGSEEPIKAIKMNALFPHQIAACCRQLNARLIHISTDCVFSGRGQLYTEEDRADADDFYGRSKLLGEVNDGSALTIRTSIIGHQLKDHHSLIDWFLSQKGTIKGFKKAIFSGFPTIVLAKIIEEWILLQPNLCGLYHLSSQPISKYDLLHLVKKIYRKSIDIIPDDTVQIDRSLDSTRFQKITGYTPAPWETLIQQMYTDRIFEEEKHV